LLRRADADAGALGDARGGEAARTPATQDLGGGLKDIRDQTRRSRLLRLLA